MNNSRLQRLAMTGSLLVLAPLCQSGLAQEHSIKNQDDGATLWVTPGPLHAPYGDSLQGGLLQARRSWEKLKTAQGVGTLRSHAGVELYWPVRESVTFPDYSVQTVAAFLDQDPSAGGILDWNCGDRTFDGHTGVDIALAPYPWYHMRMDHGIVVAAAAGTIVDKVGDQPEDSCVATNESGENNRIAIEHADGSWAIYAHMRTDSLTEKEIGDTVEAGDYLGVVGSSGASSQPHLHFAVGFWEGDEFIYQDPWEGTCNDLNAEGWWAQQQPYLAPAILSVASHVRQPNLPAAPCPDSENPGYEDNFLEIEDRRFFYLSATLRDQPAGEMLAWAIVFPNGERHQQQSRGDPNNDLPGARTELLAVQAFESLPRGQWELDVTFMGEHYRHYFWLREEPPEPDPMPVDNNQFNGLWYDASLDGEGYNFITSASGTVVFFYGSDVHGNRFWLVSETVGTPFQTGQKYTITMYESTGGTHSMPMKSARGLSQWGTLRLTLDDCDHGTAILEGLDGTKTSSIVKLAAVPGTVCGDGNRADAAQSGLWFSSGLDGEGFNLIVAANGVVVFYYGFDADGNRLWLVSETIDSLINSGNEIMAKMFKATSGTFDSPVPSDQALEEWGTLTVKVNGCDTMDYTLDTMEGIKVSDTVRLAGILGLDCG